MKTRKILSVLLAAAMLIGLMPALSLSFAASVDDLSFELNDDGESYYISRCSGDASGELIIPTTYNEKPVIGIGIQAFFNCSELTSITVPDSVTSIGEYAFYGCTNLTSITIPDSVTNIDSAAFYGTAWLTNQPDGLLYVGKIAYEYKGEMPDNTSFVLAEGTIGIADYAFQNCTGLTSITIPDSVTTIGEYAFSYNDELTSVSIGNSVSTIGWFAFYACDGLTSITLPNSLTSIGGEAFCSCNRLSSITIPDSVTKIDQDAFSGTTWYEKQPDGLIYAGKVAYEYKGAMPNNTTIELADGTNSITSSAFKDCTNLTSITIPDSVTSINNYAFSGCTGLTSITISDSVTSIDFDAFSGCTGLTSITISDSVTSIGRQAFDDTAWYNNQPDGLVYAGKFAYKYKGEMPDNTSIVFADGTKGIADSAFEDCADLTSVTIPNSVTSIGSNAFCDCTELVSVTIPDSVVSIGYNAFFGWIKLTIYCNHGSFAETYANVKNLRYLTIGNNLTFELNEDGESYCVSNCHSRAYGELVIPGTYNDKPVTCIGRSAFEGCTELTSVTIPDSVTELGWYSFKGCTELTSVSIPDSVEIIGDGAFSDSAWYINQPDGLVYAGKVVYAFKGEMPMGSSIEIADGTKGITGDAFYGCTGLASVTIPNSVTNIGGGAFYECTNLTSISIPSSVTSIGGYAFYGCIGLTSIVIPDSLTNINAYQFQNCTRLTSITIPDSVISISSVAFPGCDNLTIYCNPGSFAEEYAIENGINHAGIGETQTDEISSDTLTVSDGIISGLKCGDTIENTLEELNSSENTKVFGLDGNEITDASAKLGTGMLIKLFNEDGEVLDEVTVSVLGDLDGNGEITTDDARNVLRATVGLENHNNAQLLAADVIETAGDDPITTDDARFLLRVTVELESL